MLWKNNIILEGLETYYVDVQAEVKAKRDPGSPKMERIDPKKRKLINLQKVGR